MCHRRRCCCWTEGRGQDMDYSSLVRKMLIYGAILLQHVVSGQLISIGRGIQATNTGRSVCSTNRDCDPDGVTGEVCWLLYDGCNSGKCMCDPRSHVLDATTGRCVIVRRNYEPCGSNDTCIDSLTCINGTCRCPYDQLPSVETGFSSDRFCVQPTDRFLGKACSPTVHNCYHLSSYGLSTNEAECNVLSGQCSCREGYRRDGPTCRRLRIWESGCREDFHCGGGAVCVDEQCACPSGYRAVAGNTKCAKFQAMLELSRGHHCDEINEQRYCAYGLVCHRCRESDSRPICARYLSGYEPDRSAFVSQSSPRIYLLTSTTIISSLVVLASLFFTRLIGCR